jgi:CheY-like chemotaxis protein
VVVRVPAQVSTVSKDHEPEPEPEPEPDPASIPAGRSRRPRGTDAGTSTSVRTGSGSGSGSGSKADAGAKGNGNGAPHRSLRIVVVEDNADIRETLRDFLELSGHRVEVAHDGPAGVAMVLAREPHVALVDIGLPGLDGYGVAAQVRAAAGANRTRLIALTGYGQPEDRRRALEAGFDAHLVKPVNPTDLAKLLQAGDHHHDE